MFKNFMNNYYYGKSGKADFTEEDLPTTRRQLFLDTLRTRFSALMRLNLLYMLVWLPAMLVLLYTGMQSLTVIYSVSDGSETQTAIVETTQAADTEAEAQTETTVTLTPEEGSAALRSLLSFMLLLMIPCITITGPFTAGLSYVTRNWARDEHAFIWSDFKDAVKSNWKQSLVVSFLTSLMPFIVYMCWVFYGELSQTQALMIIPQVVILMVGILWALSVTYAYPMIVSYELKLRDLFRNCLLLSIARLPMSLGIRLLHCLPILLGVTIGILFNVPAPVLLVLFLYYAVIGFSLSRFVTASYTNAVFEKFINPRIEGAPVNRGLRTQEDEDEDEEDEEENEEENEN